MPRDADRHAAALAAIEAGRVEEGHGILVDLLRDRLDGEHLNDLAVASHLLGRLDDAASLLRAALVIGGRREDLVENLTAVEREQAHRQAAWRSTEGIAGEDAEIPERAYPGMPGHSTMGEHCVRYAYATSLVGGYDVLDLGCGTGYGSEMLTWSAARVRGFDIWRPELHQHPQWPGGAELHYGHDLCGDPLPPADAAVMFEVLEHLPDAPAALRLVWAAVPALIASFPNPEHHGSHLNPHHVNDWALEDVEREVSAAAAGTYRSLEITHLHQPAGTALLVPGRDPDAPFWVFVVQAVG